MSDPEIFSKFTLGGQELSNRLVLAPMTRARYVVMRWGRAAMRVDHDRDQSFVGYDPC